jgi:transcriptional regulator with XRE-family HTH domain
MQTNQTPVSMDDLRTRLATNLRRLRAEREISQERLALEAGVDRTMLSKIERRVSNPSIETLLKLANRLSVDLVAIVAPVDPATDALLASGNKPVRDRPALGLLAVHEPRPANRR